MNYGEQLKDPRWQKRRLEIMQRDNFTCQKCGNGLNDGVSLNVHHLVYRKCQPWEYLDYELVTLCENCHHETHNAKPKKPKKQKSVTGSPKIIFYRSLLKGVKELTPNEKIVYSFLVYKSLCKTDWAFKGGKLDKEAICCFINNNNSLISIRNFNKSKIAKTLYISVNTITRSFCNLEKYGYIKNDGTNWWVFVNWELLSNGYFELYHLDKLKGDLAIFFAYIADKGSRHNYNIDTWKTQMAKDLDKTKLAITKLLNRLYRLKLAKRLDNGRLLVKQPE